MSDGWPGAVVAAIVIFALVVDNVRTFRLRDVLTIGGLAATVAVTAICSLVTGQPLSLVGALVGAAGLFLLCFAAELVRPGTLGFGTVKSTALMGAATGGLGLAPWIGGLLGFGVATAVLGLIAWRVTRSTLPTGPALVAGLVASVAVRLMA